MHRLKLPLGALLLPCLAMLVGCTQAPSVSPCSVEVDVSGSASWTWAGADDLEECDGFGPSIDDSVSLYWSASFDQLQVRIDFIEPGDTGTFDAFVSLEHNDDQWASYSSAEPPVACTATLDRHEDVGATISPTTRRYEVEGSADCDNPLTGATGTDGTVTVSHIDFVHSYDEYTD